MNTNKKRRKGNTLLLFLLIFIYEAFELFEDNNPPVNCMVAALFKEVHIVCCIYTRRHTAFTIWMLLEMSAYCFFMSLLWRTNLLHHLMLPSLNTFMQAVFYLQKFKHNCNTTQFCVISRCVTKIITTVLLWIPAMKKTTVGSDLQCKSNTFTILLKLYTVLYSN